jgi:hypothetical protein
MKRGQRWSAAKKADEGHPGSEGGPLRRRRALRHLDSLALDPGREPNPAAATAHVRVIGEGGDANSRPSVVPRQGNRLHGGAAPTEDRADEVREGGPRVQAVPIDQPIRAEPTS